MASVCQAPKLIGLPAPLRCQILRHALASPLSAQALRPRTCPTLSLASPRCYATYNTNATDSASQSSVNATEVSHFNTLASSWWDPHGSSRLLHLMNPLRHKFIRQCFDKDVHHTPPAKLRFLDVGCGGGIFAESAARLPTTASVTAIDPTPEVIAVARKHQRTDPLLLEPKRLEYKNIAIEHLPAEEQFDIISLFEVVEHIQQPAPFLDACLAHLKPGGWLVGSTIARTGVSWFTTKFVAEEVLRMVPRGTHEWSQYIQPSEMREWARKQDVLDVSLGGLGWRGWECMGVVYVPGFGWKEVKRSEDWGNYFFGVRKRSAGE